MNIQLEKALIIDQLKNINDADLIRTLQSVLNNSLKKSTRAGFTVSEHSTIRKRTAADIYPIHSFLG
jgi:hypothetical protein